MKEKIRNISTLVFDFLSLLFSLLLLVVVVPPDHQFLSGMSLKLRFFRSFVTASVRVFDFISFYPFFPISSDTVSL
jgi:hypothetical protein